MHTFFGRAERVEKDDLFPEGHPFENKTFQVNKISLGYVYDFITRHSLKFGVGGLLSAHFVPDDLEIIYGRIPLSYMLFVRMKL